jgi:hypothetical protein
MKRRFIDFFKKNARICPRRLLLYLIAGAFLCFPNRGMTDQTPLFVEGGGVSPKSEHETVRMDSEQVIIRLGQETYTVDAVFHLFNTGETVTEWVGFPKRRIKLIVGGSAQPDFVRFDTWVDGRHVEVTELPDPHADVSFWEERVAPLYDRLLPSVYRFTRRGYMRNGWMAQRVTFPRHARTSIRTIYEAEYPYRGPRRAVYIFGTGRYWKGGIGEATFVIDCTGVGGTSKVDVDFPVAPGPKTLSGNVIAFDVKKLNPPPDAQLIAVLVNR